jgi:hypothetical protein
MIVWLAIHGMDTVIIQELGIRGHDIPGSQGRRNYPLELVQISANPI